MELITSYEVIFISAFLLACVTIVGLRPIAANIGLVDRPDARKKHLGDIPLIGGIAIYFTLLVISQIFIPSSHLVN